ncbi:unnamed protein product [Clavelina lepadiformis]|uniref:Protein-PII uridylyltransferase N-terminal domain-containing protein n=1 Tax=Clavelina lepadiformis TaxID=159417 RepID=A0ABP0GKE0_CLALP
MDQSKAEELELATKLKTDLCDANGREKDPVKCAEIFHKMGIIYMNRANLTKDKLCFIQSATLLNAAIVRDPANKAKVEKDLQTLCLYLLKSANAEDDQADLLLETKRLKEMVDKMRTNTKDELKLLNNIPDEAEGDKLRQLEEAKIKDVQNLQEKVTKDFKAIMKVLADFCSNVMGKSRCDYVLVGMGSLARREVTPFSDFENVIVLEEDVEKLQCYEEILEYYRWFSRGISFDGFIPYACKSPLGRFWETEAKHFTTELIKSVDAMVRYLDSTEDEKNGYHLADVLSRNCFVAGSIDLYEKFDEKIRGKLLSEVGKSSIASKICDYIKEDLNKFGVRNHLFYVGDAEGCNVKSVIYRSITIFIPALGKLLGIKPLSSFEIIDELSRLGFCDDFAHKLKYAVALACEIRLKVYFQKGAQDDWLDEWSMSMSDVGELSQTVGAKRLIDYFLIAYSLQYDIAKYLKFPLVNFYESPEVLVAVANYYFRRYQSAIQSGKFILTNATDKNDQLTATWQNCSHKTELSLFGKHYSQIQQHLDNIKNTEIPGLSGIYQNISKQIVFSQDIADTLKIMGICFVRMEKYKEALLANEQELAVREKLQKYDGKERDIAICSNCSGLAWAGLGNHKQSLLKEKSSLNSILGMKYKDKNRDLVVMYLNVGCQHNALQQNNRALTALREGMQILRKLPPTTSTKRYLSRFRQEIGVALFNKQKFDNALNEYKTSLKTRKQISQDETKDEDIATIISSMAQCLRSMGESTEAKKLYEQELVIHENVLSDQSFDFYITGRLDRKGICLDNLTRHKEAIECYKSALTFRKQCLSDLPEDRYITLLNLRLGNSLCLAKKWKEALSHYQRGLEIALIPKESWNDDLRNFYHRIAICLENLDRHEEALKHYQLSVENRKLFSENAAKDKNIAVIYNNMENCLRKAHKFQEALTICEKSLHIHRLASEDKFKDLDVANNLHKVSTNNSVDDNVANTHREIANCLTYLGSFPKALHHFDLAIEVKRRLSTDQCKKEFISVLDDKAYCFYLADCYDKSNEIYEEILIIVKSALKDRTSSYETAVLLSDCGNYLLRLQQYEEAMQHFQSSLDMRKKLKQDDKYKITGIYNGLGTCLKNIGEVEDALRYFQLDLNIKQNIHSDGNAHYDLVCTLNDIGLCLDTLVRHNEALDYYKRSLSMREELATDVSIDKDVSVICKNIGICLLNLERFEEALNYYDRSLNVWKKLHKHVADDKVLKSASWNTTFYSIHTSIGKCLYNLGRKAEALKQYQLAVEMKTSTSNDREKDKDLAEINDIMGICLREMHDFHQALEVCEKSLQIRKLASEDESKDMDVAKSLHEISLCFTGLNKFDDALEKHLCYLEITKRTNLQNDNGNKAVATGLYYVGTSLFALDNYEDALRYFREALEIQKNTSSNVSMDETLAKTQHVMGKCLAFLSRFEESLKHLRFALDIYKQSKNGKDKENLFNILSDIGGCLSLANRSNEAKEINKAVLAKLKSGLSNRNPSYETAGMLYSCALKLFHLHQHEEALENFQASLEMRKQLNLQEEDERIASTYHNIGKCLQEMGKAKEALSYLENDLNILKQIYPDKHPNRDFICSLNQIGSCLYSLQRFEEALPYFKRSLSMRQELIGKIDSDKDASLFCYNIGQCLAGLKQFADALEYFHQGLEIWKKVDETVVKDKLIAEFTAYIKFCSSKLQTTTAPNCSLM